MWKNWMILNLHKNYLWSRPRRQWTAWPYLMSGSRTHHVLLLQSAGSPRFPCGVSRPGNHGNRYHLHFHQNCRYFNTTQQSMGPSNGPPSLWPVATWCRRWYRSKNEVVVVNTCYIDYWGFPAPAKDLNPEALVWQSLHHRFSHNLKSHRRPQDTIQRWAQKHMAKYDNHVICEGDFNSVWDVREDEEGRGSTEEVATSSHSGSGQVE